MDPLKTAATTTDAKLHFLDYWRIIRIRKTIILTVFLLVVLTTVAVTLSLHLQYRAIALIKVSKDQSDITEFFGQQNGFQYDPYFIQTEFEVIKSQQILDQVITNLNLNVEWGEKYAGEPFRTAETRTLVGKFLDLRPTRNTSIIEIHYYSGDTNEAARIANEVATVYKQYRLGQRNEQTLSGINALKKNMMRNKTKSTKPRWKWIASAKSWTSMSMTLLAMDLPLTFRRTTCAGFRPIASKPNPLMSKKRSFLANSRP